MDESTAALPKVTTSYGVADKVVTAVLAAAMLVWCIVTVSGPRPSLKGNGGYVFIAAASVTFPVAFTVPQVVEAFCGAPKPANHHWFWGAPKSAPPLRVLPDGAKMGQLGSVALSTLGTCLMVVGFVTLTTSMGSGDLGYVFIAVAFAKAVEMLIATAAACVV